MANQSHNALSVFNFNDAPMRVITKDGEPWFVAGDVCGILGLSHITNALAGLEADEGGVALLQSPSGMQEMRIIAESGLYTLVLNSRKPEAKTFKRWLLREVLPTIRKTGTYTAPGSKPKAKRALDQNTQLGKHLKACKLMGMDQRQSIIHADRVMLAEGFPSMIATYMPDFHAEVAQDHAQRITERPVEWYTATAIGKIISPMVPLSGIAVNQELFTIGLLCGYPTNWQLTEAGKSYGRWTTEPDARGIERGFFKWHPSVIGLLTKSPIQQTNFLEG